jgi:uncharacterized damage-inducible protein DinB
MLSTRPAPTEYAPFYARYIDLVPQGDLFAILAQQREDALAMLAKIPEAKGNVRYTPGKWSIKEVVGHIIDSERIFAYRALRFGRNDATPLPGFEQDDYVRSGNFDACSLHELAEEFGLVRQATLTMLRHFGSDAWDRRGTANKTEVSVRALAYIIAGHERHHMDILRTKYTVG